MISQLLITRYKEMSSRANKRARSQEPIADPDTKEHWKKKAQELQTNLERMQALDLEMETSSWDVTSALDEVRAKLQVAELATLKAETRTRELEIVLSKIYRQMKTNTVQLEAMQARGAVDL